MEKKESVKRRRKTKIREIEHGIREGLREEDIEKEGSRRVGE